MLPFSFRQLAMKYHPDSRLKTTGDEDEIMKLITMAWASLKEKKDRILKNLPIFIKSDSVEKIPVVIDCDGSNLQEKVSRFLGFDIDGITEYQPLFKPWVSIDIMTPVNEFHPPHHTDMIFIKQFYQPILEKLQPIQLSGIMKRFIGGGKRCFKQLIRKGEDQVVLAFTGQITFCIRTGRDIDPQSLTFNRFCALLGDINRRNQADTGEAVVPSFSKNIITDHRVPKIFKYFLHHGVYLSWDFTGCERSKNRMIYFAVKCMDLVLINNKRKLENKPAHRTIFHMDEHESEESQTFREDFVKFIGINRLIEFESQNKEFIAEKSRYFVYTV